MTDEPPRPSESTTRRARLLERADLHRVPLAAIIVTVVVVAVAYLLGKLLYRLRDVLLLMVVAGFLALVLNPIVDFIQGRGVRRGVAVSAVGIVTLAIFGALAVAFGAPLVTGLTHLANALPNYVRKAEHGKGWIGHLLRHYHVENWIRRNSSKLVSLAQGLSKPALALGKGAVSVALASITTFVFVFLMLLEAPRLESWLLSLLSDEHAARVMRVGREVGRRSSGYVLGNLLTSLVAGTVVFVTLLCLGVPFPFLWALWVALVDFLPTIGGALAGIPTVLFALGHSLTAGVLTAVVFIVYTQLENHILNPYVMSRTVRLNPLTVLVAVLVGAELGSWVGGLFGGFVGVLLAVPAAATIQVVARELWSPGPLDGP